MSIASEITALTADKTAIYNAIVAKGGTVSAADGFDDFATAIGTISGGGSEAFGYLIVAFPNGATSCTAVKGSTTLNANMTNSTYTFLIPESGTWTITAYNGSTVIRTATVSITVEHELYTLNLKLPAEYQEVEYISFPGYSYINTGVIPTDHALEIEFALSSGSGNVHPIFGVAVSSYAYQHYTMSVYSGTYYYGINGAEYNYGSWSSGKHSFKFNYGSDHEFSLDGTVLKSGITATESANLYIGRRGTGSEYLYDGYIYGYKITDNSTETVVQNCSPCYRISDSTPGFYDIINDTFYANAGTGTLTCGPAVNDWPTTALTITANGTYTRMSGGYSPVTVNVPGISVEDIEIEQNLSNWTMCGSPTFPNSYADGVNTVTGYVGRGGFERIILDVTDLDADSTYIFSLKFCSPSGFEYGGYSDKKAGLVSFNNRRNNSSALSEQMTSVEALSYFQSTSASSTPIEYAVIVSTGSRTTAYLSIEIGAIKDGTSYNFIFSDIKLQKILS